MSGIKNLDNVVNWNDILNKPDEFIANWSNLVGKPTVINNLVTILNSATQNQLITFDVSNNAILISTNVANGILKLDSNAKIPTAQLPSIAISDVSVVEDNTERDGLTVETGDFARVTSTGKTFIYDGSTWLEILTTSDVNSVNGQTGDVVLNTDNIAEGTTNKYMKEYHSEIFTAGENVALGDVCRLNSSGQMVKADNTAFATAEGLIGVASETINSGLNGRFIVWGVYNFPSWTAPTNGQKIFLSASGGITNTEPATTGHQVRNLGYCINSTSKTFYINVDETIWEAS